MFTHTDQKDFKCEICGTAFRTKGSLIRHKRRHTGNADIQSLLDSCCFENHDVISSGR